MVGPAVSSVPVVWSQAQPVSTVPWPPSPPPCLYPPPILLQVPPPHTSPPPPPPPLCIHKADLGPVSAMAIELSNLGDVASGLKRNVGEVLILWQNGGVHPSRAM